MLALRDEVDPEPWVGLARLLPHAVVDGRGHAVRVGVGHQLDVAQPGHVACGS